jgi:hypothetical protein
MKTFYFSNVVNKGKQSEFENADDMIAQDEVQSWTAFDQNKKPSGFTKCRNLNSLATTGFSIKTLPLRVEWLLH